MCSIVLSTDFSPSLRTKGEPPANFHQIPWLINRDPHTGLIICNPYIPLRRISHPPTNPLNNRCFFINIISTSISTSGHFSWWSWSSSSSALVKVIFIKNSPRIPKGTTTQEKTSWVGCPATFRRDQMLSTSFFLVLLWNPYFSNPRLNFDRCNIKIPRSNHQRKITHRSTKKPPTPTNRVDFRVQLFVDFLV